MEKDAGNDNAKISDWQATVSQKLEVVDLKKMTIDMSKTRLKPVFLSTGNLVVIIPAASEQEAGAKALKIARQIASDETWGIDLMDFTGYNLE